MFMQCVPSHIEDHLFKSLYTYQIILGGLMKNYVK